MKTAHPHTVDIAGTAWPLYKLEALAAGVLVAVVLAVVTGAPQVAVLLGAALAVVRWTAGSLGARRAAAPLRPDRVFAAH
ncbi:hypothetical protein [Nocardia sp. NPDC048505]|uniref:hypothetical protein n=1 Tax=unclassified Nocardia TaxID=2637762 RepID=UPI0033FBCFB6